MKFCMEIFTLETLRVNSLSEKNWAHAKDKTTSLTQIKPVFFVTTQTEWLQLDRPAKWSWEADACGTWTFVGAH